MILTIGGKGCDTVECSRLQQIVMAANSHIVLFTEQLVFEEDLSLDFFYPTLVAIEHTPPDWHALSWFGVVEVLDNKRDRRSQNVVMTLNYVSRKLLFCKQPNFP